MTYWAHSPHLESPLTLLDFEAQFLSSGMFDGIIARLNHLGRLCRPRYGKLLFPETKKEHGWPEVAV